MTAAYHFFYWLSRTYIGTHMREGDYDFPTIEALHIMGSVLLVASTSILSLRLSGLFMNEVPVSNISRNFLPWAWAGFAIQLITGTLLFMSEAPIAYATWIFQVKMVLVLLAGVNALVFQTTVFRRISTWDLGRPPFGARVAGYASIVIWFAVVAAGRWVNSAVSSSAMPH